MTTTNKSWTVTVGEAEDGSGDLVLPLPQEMLDLQGWTEGDVLDWIDNKDGTWSIAKKDAIDVNEAT